MPRFCANLTMLFTEHEFLDRFEAAARAGFRGVEYLFPYAWPKEELARRLRASDLVQVLHNLPAGDWAGGERGIAILPGRVDEFRAGVGRAIEYAQALGCAQLNCLAGVVPPGLAAEEARETLVRNLRFAAEELRRAGIRLLVEPINTFDIPGFFLCRTAQALELLRDVGSDNLFLQFDAYHMQRIRASRTSRSPTTRDGTSQAPARSTTRSCSSSSTGSATRAGSAASTSPRRAPRRASAGSGPTPPTENGAPPT
jgi:hydroxypyruvate isomerase